MNRPDPIESWLAMQRASPAPQGLTDRVMAAIECAATERPARRSPWRRVAPWLVGTAAAFVGVLRLYSVVAVLINPSAEYSVVSREELEERKAPSDAQRSLSGS